MSKFSMYEEPRDGALYEVVSSDKYAISRRLTPDVVDSQLASAARNITKRLRSLGIMHTINFINPNERDYYDIADAFLKVIEQAESNDVRIRQDFISIKNKYDALAAQIDKHENENARLKEEIRVLQKKLSTEREEHKVELRNTARAAQNAEYKAQAAEKLRTVAEKNNSKLKDMLQNSRTFSVTKSYGAPTNATQRVGGNLGNSRIGASMNMSKSMTRSALGRSMSAGAGHQNMGPARPRNTIFSPAQSSMDGSRAERYDAYRGYDNGYNNVNGNSSKFSYYEDSLRPMSDKLRGSQLLIENESFMPYDPLSMVRDSQLYTDSLRPYQSLKPPKCPSLRETDVPPDYAISNAHHAPQGQPGSRSVAQSPGSVRHQPGPDKSYDEEEMQRGFTPSRMSEMGSVEHRARGSLNHTFSQNASEPTLMSVGELIEKYHSGTSASSSNVHNPGSITHSSHMLPDNEAKHIAELEMDSRKKKLEKMQGQIAEAVSILNRAGIMVDLSKRET